MTLSKYYAMTYWCPICDSHRDEEQCPGEGFGSIFFPEGVLVCQECIERHTGNPWFNEELIQFEKEAPTYLSRALEHLVNGRVEEKEKLEYGENISLLFEENKKFYDEVTRLEKMKVDFSTPSSDWAEVLYRIAWRQDERYVGERVSWKSTSNKRMIQARIISINEEKKQFKLRALESENYKVKDKNGILRKGADKIVGLYELLPPRTLGINIYKKQQVCHGCCRMHLLGGVRRGLDYDNEHWFCSGCKIMSFGDLPLHEVKAYHEHFGEPMKEIPEHHKEKFREHNISIMKKQVWPCTHNKPWPDPLPKKRNVKKFGDTQEENDLRWTGDIKYLSHCNGCGMKVREGWADSRVDPKDWNCKWCWSQYKLRDGCLDKPNVISHREGTIILPSNEVTSMSFESLWKIKNVEVDEVFQPKQGKNKKKKGKKMNLQEFYQTY